MVEGASLESLYMGNCIVGSNPILSAIKPKRELRFFFIRNCCESLLSKAVSNKEKAAFVKGEVLLTVHPIRDHHR